ncbi:hypothetical protein H2198_008836 [Neophaeococcomyces mojaviensis]|uniref:Uncharacterized protein n=1 Tax=Neophaeococcomyces mojaviensis TaxID=3383035 RepID=A0ACC2ZW25_9EURO|nr:hypothetical protein H2198_008836 [Knufia sp. JES_112]
MEPAQSPKEFMNQTTDSDPPVWTYPTRFCRICREDVPPTVTMYPPGVPMQFQRPVVEYKNEDEYGRLIKPCMCRGSSRYIHELCLLRSRTENTRADSMWKCHECGYKFDFKKLTIQRFLSSRLAAATLTVWFMVFLMFLLGFIADPIINIYMDPYDSLTGRESIWDELQVGDDLENPASSWWAHFAKGFISMGLFGFLKTVLLNPWNWMNLRYGSSMSSRTTTQSGRDRAVNISWIALVIGIFTAFVFFYRWVETFVQRSLVRIGNNIVDTQLPGDDDDLKPPSGWKYQTSETATPDATGIPQAKPASAAPSQLNDPILETPVSKSPAENASKNEKSETKDTEAPTLRASTPASTGSWTPVDATTDNDSEPSTLSSVHRQGWSFSNL